MSKKNRGFHMFKGPPTIIDDRGVEVTAAHIVFDRMWRCHHNARSARRWCYRWLASEMGLTAEECHFGKMTPEQCRTAIRLCRKADLHRVYKIGRRLERQEAVLT